jgi:hypothetical protein
MKSYNSDEIFNGKSLSERPLIVCYGCFGQIILSQWVRDNQTVREAIHSMREWATRCVQYRKWWVKVV